MMKRRQNIGLKRHYRGSGSILELKIGHNDEMPSPGHPSTSTSGRGLGANHKCQNG